MCTYYYLHYHHIPPCTRDIDYAVQYTFCANARTEAPSRERRHHSSRSGRQQQHQHQQQQQQQQQQQPCEDLTYAPEYNPVEGIDYNNPCAMGGCLSSQQCTSGGCRLEDLGHRWVCCQCHRGNNTFRYCAHTMKKVPDTLCYHVVCQDCWADS